MADRMRFILDGDDRLSPVLNRAGDSSARLHRRLSDDSQASSRALRAFTRDANGQLRDLEGRFVSVAHASRLIRDSNGRWRDLNGRFIANATAAQRMATVTAGLPSVLRTAGQAAQTVNVRMRDARGRFIGAGGALSDLGDAAGDASEQLGAKGGGLSGVMGGVAAVAGLSLLPALGALVPMMAGTVLATSTLQLGFAGVGDAMEASGKSKEEYQKALKKLSPEARSFTKELVGMKKEFSGVGKDVQKAMLPGFTKAVKDAGPLVKILGDNMTDLGGTFGKAAESAGRVFKESGFQKDLQANLDLGKQFVGDMMSGFGGLGRSLLDFGAASKPTLTALSGGIRDVLGNGLPGMFDGLKVGIEGSSKFLTGFFNMINSLLPAIGRFAGEVARATGPLLGEMFTSLGVRGAGALDSLGQVVKALTPVFKDLGYGLKATTQFMQIIAPTVKDAAGAIVGSLLPSFSQVDQAQGPLQRLSGWIQNNKVAIQEFARQGASAFITLVQAGVQHFPTLIKIFRIVTGGMVIALGGVLHAAATAFGWIPGIGGKLKKADAAFSSFKDSYLSGLKKAEDKARGFAASVVPKLSAGKLKLNIENWQSQIETAKAKMKTVPPGKRAKLQATIDDLRAKVSQAKGELASIRDKTVTVTTFLTYKGKSMAAVSAGRMATGGPVGFPGGGAVRGPGTSTSDSIPAMLSDGEYVINARSTAKYRSLIEAINTNRLGSDGSVGGAGTAVAQGLAGGMTASFGLVKDGARRMAAAVLTGIRAELEISSPSKKTKALAKDIGKGLIVGLTGSRDKIKATAKDLAKDIWTAFSGSKDNRLVAMVNKQTGKLLAAAKKRDSIAATIKRATEFAESTRVGAKKSASLSSMFEGGEEQVTAAGIQGKLSQKLTKMKTFTSYIKTLAKRGLNKTMLREILEMRPEQGYAYASALAGANQSIFKSINATQYAINDQAEKLGRSGADALYDSGKNASKGFLSGLKTQQKAIEKFMVDIAKGMQKALRKALGIKSPSTVMARLGAYSTEGLARGLVDGMPVLDSALSAVSGRVAATQPVLGRAAVTGRSGGATIHIHVNGAVVDKLGAARAVREALLEFKRTNGGGALGLA